MFWTFEWLRPSLSSYKPFSSAVRGLSNLTLRANELNDRVLAPLFGVSKFAGIGVADIYSTIVQQIHTSPK